MSRSRSRKPHATHPHPEPGPPDGARGSPAPGRDDGELTPDEQDAVQTRVALDRFVSQSNAEIHGLFEILGRKRRLLTVNFLAGLSRGAGFFVGVTLVGGLFLGSVALAVDWTASALGWKDVTFRSLMEVVARKAIEAKDVWEDVKEQEGVLPVGSDDSTAPKPAGTSPQEAKDGDR